jgi:hypothetical protein
MKNLVFALLLFGLAHSTFAEETVSEKADKNVKAAHRSVKKGIHRTTEAICGKLTGDNKVQCLAKEAKNRIEDGKDVVVDKVSEIKNKADEDKK